MFDEEKPACDHPDIREAEGGACSEEQKRKCHGKHIDDKTKTDDKEQ